MCEVAAIVERDDRRSTWSERMERSLANIETLVRHGLVEIGDLTGPGGRFANWESPVDAQLARIRSEWTTLGRDPTLYEVCWLNPTEKGSLVARALLWLETWEFPARA